MTPEQIAKPDTEAAHQMALFAWAALNAERLPELKWLHHIPNGGSRGDTERSRAIEGGKLKAQGVKAGVLDLFLPVGRHGKLGLYVEMKKPGMQSAKNGGLSDSQIEFGAFAIAQGYACTVAYSWQEAAQQIESYLNG